MLVNGALCDFVDDPHSHRLRFARTGLVGDILPGGPHIDILPRARVADVFTATFQFVQPSLFGFLARVPLHDEPGTILNQDYQFFGSVQEIGRQIGNAVPVLLAQRIGEYILTEHKKTDEENARP